MSSNEIVKGSQCREEILEKITSEISRLHSKLDNSDAVGEFDEISGRIKGLDFAKRIIFSTHNN